MAFLLHGLFAKDLVLHILAVKLFDTLIVVGCEFYLTQWISSDCIGVKGNIILLNVFLFIYLFFCVCKGYM